MVRNTYLNSDTTKLASDLELQRSLVDGRATLAFQAALPAARAKLRESAFGSPTATEWQPLPSPEPVDSIVSARPDAMAIREQQQATQQRLYPPRPTPTAPQPAPGTGDGSGYTRASPSGSGNAGAYPPRPQPTGGAYAPSPGDDEDTQRIGSAGTRASARAAIIAKAAREEGVPADYLAALYDTEMSDDASVSPAGARGGWQVVPGQGYDMPGEDASDPETSARQGARALKDKYRATGSWSEAARAYFGYGTDAGGMDTDTYGNRIEQNRSRYSQGAPQSQMASGAAGEDQPYDVAFGFNQQYDQPFNSAIQRHRGVDLVVRGAEQGGRGTPVKAFEGGTVAAVTQDPNGGNGVIIQTPDGLYHRYFHFDAITVEQGQKIEAGAPIGVLGASGTEGFPHVHFEVSRDINGDPQDSLIDPTPYMRPRRQADAGSGTQAQPLAMASGDERPNAPAAGTPEPSPGAPAGAAQGLPSPQTAAPALASALNGGAPSLAAQDWNQPAPGERPYDPDQGPHELIPPNASRVQAGLDAVQNEQPQAPLAASSYNDPTADGTQTAPLPPQQPSYPSPSDDPGGAVQRAQDSQSTPLPTGLSPYDETPPVVPPANDPRDVAGVPRARRTLTPPLSPQDLQTPDNMGVARGARTALEAANPGATLAAQSAAAPGRYLTSPTPYAPSMQEGSPQVRTFEIDQKAQKSIDALVAEADGLIRSAPDAETAQRIRDGYAQAIKQVADQADEEKRQIGVQVNQTARQLESEPATGTQSYSRANRAYDAVAGAAYSALRTLDNLWSSYHGLEQRVPTLPNMGDVPPSRMSDDYLRKPLARGVTDIMGEEQLGHEVEPLQREADALLATYGRDPTQWPPEIRTRVEKLGRQINQIYSEGGRYASERAPGTEGARLAVDLALGAVATAALPGGVLSALGRAATGAERAGALARIGGSAIVDPLGTAGQVGLEALGPAARGAASLVRSTPVQTTRGVELLTRQTETATRAVQRAAERGEGGLIQRTLAAEAEHLAGMNERELNAAARQIWNEAGDAPTPLQEATLEAIRSEKLKRGPEAMAQGSARNPSLLSQGATRVAESPVGQAVAGAVNRVGEALKPADLPEGVQELGSGVVPRREPPAPMTEEAAQGLWRAYSRDGELIGSAPSRDEINAWVRENHPDAHIAPPDHPITPTDENPGLLELPEGVSAPMDAAVASIRESRTKAQQETLRRLQQRAETKLGAQKGVRQAMEGQPAERIEAEIRRRKLRLTKEEEASRYGFTGKDEIVAALHQGQLVPPEVMAGALGGMPEYLQGVAQFIAEQRQKLVAGKLGVDDVVKAYAITVGSIQAGAQGVEHFEGGTFGRKLRSIFTDQGKVRPEEAVAAWFFTPEGQKALATARSDGKITPEEFDSLLAMRGQFGSNTIRNSGLFGPMDGATRTVQRDAAIPRGRDGVAKTYDMRNVHELTDALNAAKGDPVKIQAALDKVKGIKDAKYGFIKHLLGLGNSPTFDAVEINTWITGKGDIGALSGARTTPSADLARAAKLYLGGRQGVGKVLFPQIQTAFDELNRLGLGRDVTPEVFNHIMHHWIWDASKGLQTTHSGMYEAMRHAANVGPVEGDGLRNVIRNFAGGSVAGSVLAPVDEQASPEEQWKQRFGAAVGGGALAAIAGTRTGSNLGRAFDRAIGNAPEALRAGERALGSGVVPRTERAAVNLEGLSPVARAVAETYSRVTPARVEANVSRAVQVAADAIASKIPQTGGLSVPPTELVRDVHAAITRNLDDSKTVMTGMRAGALEAYMRGEGLTSKVETRDLGRINQITQDQVNVAGHVLGSTGEHLAQAAERSPERVHTALERVSAAQQIAQRGVARMSGEERAHAADAVLEAAQISQGLDGPTEGMTRGQRVAARELDARRRVLAAHAAVEQSRAAERVGTDAQAASAALERAARGETLTPEDLSALQRVRDALDDPEAHGLTGGGVNESSTSRQRVVGSGPPEPGMVDPSTLPQRRLRSASERAGAAPSLSPDEIPGSSDAPTRVGAEGSEQPRLRLRSRGASPDETQALPEGGPQPPSGPSAARRTAIDIGNVVIGGAGGALAGNIAPADSQDQRDNHAAAAAVAGSIGFPIAGRIMGRLGIGGAGGARMALGPVPNPGSFTPEMRAAAREARSWTRRAIKEGEGSPAVELANQHLERLIGMGPRGEQEARSILEAEQRMRQEAADKLLAGSEKRVADQARTDAQRAQRTADREVIRQDRADQRTADRLLSGAERRVAATEAAEQRAAQSALDESQIRGLKAQLDQVLANPNAPGAADRYQGLLADMAAVSNAGFDQSSAIKARLHRQGLLRAGLAARTEDTDGLVRALARAQTPEEMSALMKTISKPRLIDRVLEYQYVNMLSSPVTQATNISSNAIQLAGRLFLQNPLEFAWSGGSSTGGIGALQGAARGFREGLGEAGEIMRTGSSQSALNAAQEIGQYGRVNRESLPAWMHVISTRPLAAMDALLGHTAYASAADQYAQRTADRMLKSGNAAVQGMDRVQAKNHILQNIWDYPEIIDKAGKIEDYTLLKGRGNSDFEQKLRGMLSSRVPEDAKWDTQLKAFLVNQVVPFVGVPTNFVKQGVERALPISPLVKAGGAVLRKDREKFAEEMAKATIGFSSVVAAGYLTSGDNLTGDGPSDLGKRAIWEADHKRNSWRIPGTKQWFTWEGTPYAIPFGMVANAREGYSEAAEKSSKKGLEGAAEVAPAVALKTYQGAVTAIASQSFLKGIADQYKILSGDASLSSFSSFLASETAKAIPAAGMLNFMARVGDTVERDTGQPKDFSELRGATGARIAGRIPGVGIPSSLGGEGTPGIPSPRQKLDPRLGPYGEPVPNEQGGAMGLANAIPFPPAPQYRGTGQYQGDAITGVLGRSGASDISAPTDLPLPKSKGLTIPLTMAQRRIYDQAAGREYRKILEMVGVGKKPYSPQDIGKMRKDARKAGQTAVLNSIPKAERDAMAKKSAETQKQLVAPR